MYKSNMVIIIFSRKENLRDFRNLCAKINKKEIFKSMKITDELFPVKTENVTEY